MLHQNIAKNNEESALLKTPCHVELLGSSLFLAEVITFPDKNRKVFKG